MDAQDRFNAYVRAIESLKEEFGVLFVEGLLNQQARTVESISGTTERQDAREIWRGLPTWSNGMELYLQMREWAKHKLFPVVLVDNESLPFRTQSTSIPEMPSSLPKAFHERTSETFRLALIDIGQTTIWALLGMRTTAGSVQHALPLSRTVLTKATEAPHRCEARGPKLWEAARSLAKHCGRLKPGWDVSYWGRESEVMRGDVQSKNNYAHGIVQRILDDAVWMNVHHAPGGVQVLEIRVESGHGARWHVADRTFRGFVEPHSDDLAAEKKAKCRVKCDTDT